MIETTENKEVIYEFGKFVLDPHERILFADGKAIHLTDKVFETLLLLIQHNGRLLSKDEMMASIWKESFVEESNLAKNVSRLRKILNTGDAELIETLPRRGYRFLANVKEVNGDTSMLVHRRLRVKMTTTDDDDRVPVVRSPLALSMGQGSDVRPFWITGALAVALLALAGSGYYFLSPTRPDIDGMTNLTNNLAEDNVPAWSPDGTKISFTSNRDGAGDIYVMDADGSNVTRLTTTTAAEGSSAWSPDGSRIAFDSERDGNREIYLMNADGSNQTRLTFNPSSDVGPVSFSPDGKQIAFARNKADSGRAAFFYDVFVMNADGSGIRQLTTDPEFDAEPSWSPDGARIHFISARDGNFDLYAIDPDGTDEVNLSQAPATREGASKFTSDGRQYFCIVGDEGSPLNQIYLVNSDGMSRRQVTSFTDFVGRISFSPSTRRFALSVKKGGNWEIFVMDAKNLLDTRP